MAVMWAYILDDEVVAKATALFVGLRSQFVLSSLEEGTAHGGRRYLPYVFREQGCREKVFCN